MFHKLFNKLLTYRFKLVPSRVKTITVYGQKYNYVLHYHLEEIIGTVLQVSNFYFNDLLNIQFETPTYFYIVRGIFKVIIDGLGRGLV